MLRDSLDLSEKDAFGAALWSDVEDRGDALPEGTNLLTSTFAVLPAADGIDAVGRVHARLFGAGVVADTLRISEADSRNVEEKQSYLLSLQHAANLGFYPTSVEATSMFDEILAWIEEAGESSGAPRFFADLPQWIQDRAGIIISTVLLPSMAAEERTAGRCAKLFAAVERDSEWNGLAALCYFSTCLDGVASRLSRLVMKGLIAPNHRGVQSAAFAVVSWAERSKEAEKEVPYEVYNRLASAIELVPEHGLNALLECARKLLAIGGVPADFAVRLTHALSDLFSRTNYTEIDPASSRAVSISLVRAQCVRLAAALTSQVQDDEALERWMEEAKTDALPEVRFAAAH
ncbi:hypothetical protein [Cupriavidus pauculus]|uniref:Uncharacterized protein n=1 Tax=Cupriavidus pauculus TaxID=82633 RepID=A0A2N5C3J5_9BURK|nr:hypothetical protein [Cupriavidus pauculus]PLP96792.1 hypothetical protein CYJ10_30925 [Cupriavidus pauculus]